MKINHLPTTVLTSKTTTPSLEDRVVINKPDDFFHDKPEDTFEKETDIWNQGKPWEVRNTRARLVRMDSENEYVIDGVRWGREEIGSDSSQWKHTAQRTKIDASKLKDVYLYWEHFMPGGHAAMVFEFEEGGVVGKDGKETNRIAYSIEALKDDDTKWTPVTGLQKKMGIVNQLATFDDLKQWVTRQRGRSVEIRKVKLDNREKKRMLSAALHESFKDRTGEYYHLVNNSCYSALSKVMNAALPDHAHKPFGLVNVLMTPASVIPSGYNTMTKGMGIYDKDAIAEVHLPDPDLFPEKHVKEYKKYQRMQNNPLASLARSQAFTPVASVIGGFIGAAVGYGLSNSLLVGGVSAYASVLGTEFMADKYQGHVLSDLANVSEKLVKED